MLDPEIEKYFTERKESWLKKNIAPSMSEEAIAEKTAQCEELFNLENWLPNAAKRAGQMAISTHPCTFSHPSARKNKNGYVTSIIAANQRIADGYLRTGNIEAEKDALGNAAAIDVYKFLTLELADGNTVIDHIEKNTNAAQTLLKINSAAPEELRDGFLAMITPSKEIVTSSKIKQVFFPINDGYHQLSVLTNSGIVFELRQRIDNLRFSEKVKEGRAHKKNNTFYANGFSEIYNITTIGYGGTKPQNISVLNNQNGGKAHLLLSAPPSVEQREIRLPKNDFFIDSIKVGALRPILIRLNKIFSMSPGAPLPLKTLRKAQINCLFDIVDLILKTLAAVRNVSKNQHNPTSCKLSRAQRIWLHIESEKPEEQDWITSICDDLASWIISAHKNLTKDPVALGQAERLFIRKFIEEQKEFLR